MFENADAIDWAKYGADVLAPSEPHLPEARRMVKSMQRRIWADATARKGATLTEDELEDAMVSEGALAESWEAMLSRRDDGPFWENPRRVFVPYLEVESVQYGDQNMPRPRWKPVGTSAIPRNLATMAAMLSADPSHLLRAEELALEACQRLQPWGVTPPRLVAWTVVGPTWPPIWSSIFHWPMQAVSRTLDAPNLGRNWADNLDAMQRASGVNKRTNKTRWRFLWLAACAAHDWLRWRAMAQAGREIDALNTGFFFPSAMNYKRFADLPNVLDPYAAAWGSGYAPLDIRGDVMLMGAPAHAVPWTDLARLRAATVRRWGAYL